MSDEPGREGPVRHREAEPCTMVIFGATGDLTRRKLVPALHNLDRGGLLPESFRVVGVARRDLSDDDFRGKLEAGLEKHSRREVDAEAWKRLAGRIRYCRSSFDEAEGYRRLAACLEEIEGKAGARGNRLYYLAVPPSAFPVIVDHLREAGLNRPGKGGEWARVVVEKPIGHDLASARELNRTVAQAFAEPDVFRIDHYLGKETVQNLLVFRFANAIWEPLWNTKYIDHVQITVAESIGVEGRGAYFEEAGMTRDMVQNHMFQLLCLTAMEAPVSLDGDAIRDEKVKVLRQLRPMDPARVASDTVRAQYGAGILKDEKVPGYREEEGVAKDSCTETYVALKMYIDNWRWAQVPFYLRAGKALSKRVTEIALSFRDVPHRLFGRETSASLVPNALVLRIQPDEGIALKFEVKRPGPESVIKPMTMDFYYGESFGQSPPEAYERLILDSILGDATLFIRRDEVENSWTFVDQLFEGWRDQGPVTLPEYTAGTWGPGEADVLMARGGRTWRRP